ncbi:TPA: hypothetical protein KOR75_001119 [Clostridioides difficile]|nr:hypothetical protein [Clostridioides difficile]
MVNRLYDIISNRLSHDFKLHIGLLEADKLVIVLPVDVMNEHCSEVFDLIYTVTSEANIQRKDINKYIKYKTSDDVKDDNISWFN